MSIRRPCLMLAISGAVCFGFAETTSAQKNLSLGKKYAYFLAIPGQPPSHYRDDGPINGPHIVHFAAPGGGLGKYGRGNLPF